MRKHAYLVMVHNNYKVLEKMLLLLDAPYNEFYIHVDKKVKNFPRSYFETLLKHSKIHIYSEISVNWAGFSQIRCELFLLRHAVEENYSFYHLLSGADMPLQNRAHIYRFFEQYADMLFINFRDIRIRKDHKRFRERVSKYHLVEEFRQRSPRKSIRRFLTIVTETLLGVQRICGVDRIKNEDFFWGSQWFSIPHSFAMYLVGQQKNIERKFCYTKCPDEHVIQMMAMSSAFREKLYRNEQNQCSNMRYIEWERDEDSHPVTFRKKDIDRLLSSKMCFARKFDERINYDAAEELYARLKETEEG